jgi:hypothetical protein
MVEKRILALSFYYRPDLSAGSFRTTALVDALLEQQSSKVKIDVITTLPNRYSSFNSQAPERESSERLSIRRIKLPPHHSGKLDQAKAFVRFALEASELAKGKRYDLVFATSSRLMTAALGAWIARRSNSPLYLDIRDIFVDTIKDVVPKKVAFVLKPLFSVIERWSINGAVHVNLVSRGFEPCFKARYPKQSFSYFTNGIDEEFMLQDSAAAHKSRADNGPIRVLYAGNMGEGQGLHAIIPAVARRLRGRASFKLIGDGGRRSQLVKALAESGADNVELASPMPRDELIKEYLNADVLFLHLNDYDAFKKVLPSKIFEYAALGKPIWAGVSGYAARFLHEEVSNVAVFHPCDAEQALQVLNQLEIRDAPRRTFIHKFSRKTIMRAMAGDVLGRMRQEAVD